MYQSYLKSKVKGQGDVEANAVQKGDGTHANGSPWNLSSFYCNSVFWRIL